METQQVKALEPYQRVKFVMKTKGMNQSQFAEAMGVTRAAVSSWLNRDAERRSPIGNYSLYRMSEILNVTPEWITGDSLEGGIPIEGAIADALTAPQTPSVLTFMSSVRGIVLEERPEFKEGFEFPFITTLGHDYEPIKFDFDFLGPNIALCVDIYRNKTPRVCETLPPLLWPLLMAKRMDEVNGKEKRRYQLLLINPTAEAKERECSKSFAHQARMLGIEVAIRDEEDVKSIANLIIDPRFEDGEKRWPKELLDYQAGFIGH
jgi:transcriptional regulator with XRE-family HTH domain